MKSEFRRDVFLLWMLAGVFIFQAEVFIFALVACCSSADWINARRSNQRFDQCWRDDRHDFALLTGTTALSRAKTDPKDLPEAPRSRTCLHHRRQGRRLNERQLATLIRQALH